MRTIYSTIILLCLFTATVYAQSKKKLPVIEEAPAAPDVVDEEDDEEEITGDELYKTYIEKGVEFHDQNSYKEAIEQYMMVPPVSEVYNTAVYEMALTYLEYPGKIDSFNWAYQTALLSPTFDMHRDLWQLRGRYLIAKEDYTRALKFYDSLEKVMPTDYYTFKNKGFVLTKLGKNTEAEAVYIRAISMIPNVSETFVKYGNWLYSQGRLTEAFINLHLALNHTADNKTGLKILNCLFAITNVEDSTKNYFKLNTSNNMFKTMDQAIIDKTWKPTGTTKIDMDIAKLFIAIVENVNYVANNDNATNQLWLPYLQQATIRKNLDGFLTNAYSDVGLKNLEKVFKKLSTMKVTEMENFLIYTDSIYSTQEINYTKRQTAEMKYSKNDDGYLIIGDSKINADGDRVVYGPVKIYYNHMFFAEGSYNNDGKKIGIWKKYHNNGQLAIIENMDKVDSNGESQVHTYYNKLGFKTSSQNIFNNIIVDTSFTENDLINSISLDSAYYNNGSTTTYYSNAGVITNINSFDKPENGKKYIKKTYFDDGKIKTIADEIDGKEEGSYKSYYNNGKLEEESTMVDNNFNGKKTMYYESGNLKSVDNYKSNMLDGVNLVYFDGANKLNMSNTWVDDKLEGPSWILNIYGDTLIKINYSKNKIITYTIGKLDTTAKSWQMFKDDNYNFLKFDPIGNISGLMHLNDEGQFNGKSIEINEQGKIYKETKYDDDAIEGDMITYYLTTGNVYSKEKYKENSLNGEAIYYGYNNEIVKKGSYNYDSKEGVWYEYVDNKIYSISNYSNNALDGPVYFYNNGKLKNIEWYSDGYTIGNTHYSKEGKILYHKLATKKDSKLEYFNVAGQKILESQMDNNVWDGKQTFFYPDGTIKSTITKDKFGVTGKIANYNYPNIKQETANYKAGEVVGIIEDYTYAGSLFQQAYYENNELKKREKYILDYKYTSEIYINENTRTGTTTYFSDLGMPILEIEYYEGYIVGYTNKAENKPFVRVPLNLNFAININNAKGTPLLKLNFFSGEYDGKIEFYYSNGNIAMANTYAFGKLTGEQKKYYKSGKIYTTSTCKNDELVGSYNAFNEQGNTIVAYNFENNNFNGAAKVVTAAGKQYNLMYENDELIEIK